MLKGGTISPPTHPLLGAPQLNSSTSSLETPPGYLSGRRGNQSPHRKARILAYSGGLEREGNLPWFPQLYLPMPTLTTHEVSD